MCRWNATSVKSFLRASHPIGCYQLPQQLHCRDSIPGFARSLPKTPLLAAEFELHLLVN